MKFEVLLGILVLLLISGSFSEVEANLFGDAEASDGCPVGASPHAFGTNGVENTNSFGSIVDLRAGSSCLNGLNPENAIVSQHKITSIELGRLMSKIGIFVEGEDDMKLTSSHGTGLRPPTEDEWAQIAEYAQVVNKVEYGSTPSNVDNSAKQWFPPIGNQDGENSCVAWSVGYYTKTFQEAKEHNWNLSGATWSGGHPTPSYQDRIISPAFIYNLINFGVNGYTFYVDAIGLVCHIGACSWEKMPWNATDYTSWPSEEAWTEAPLYRGNSSGYQYMFVDTDSGLDNLKNWIASEHLATIGVDSNKLYRPILTSGDFLTLDNYVSPNSNHAGTIVGYDDNVSYTESGNTHYGALKVANSWGVGGWENVNDGFYWISYEAMKQRIGYCMFYYDLIGYQPELAATFKISHDLRGECDVTVGLGKPEAPKITKSFNNYIRGGSVPFCQNNVVFDITEFKNYVPSVYNQSYFLKVYDGGTPTIGTISKFAIGCSDSKDVPCQTVNGSYVCLNVTLSPYEADWPMFHHDLQHSGYSTSKAPSTNNTLWNYATGLGFWSSPAVVGGRVYVAAKYREVCCLDAITGALIWNYTSDDLDIQPSPAVADGRVYIGLNEKIFCLNASNGVPLWNYTTGSTVYSSPAVTSGRIYVGSNDRNVYCLDATTGGFIWSYTTGGHVYSSPAIANGRVYVGGGEDKKVYCLDATTGEFIWSYTTGDWVTDTSPAVVNGRVYIGSWDGKVYCLDSENGTLVWSFNTYNIVFSSPAVAYGKVFVGSNDFNLYCLDAASGALVWNYTTGLNVEASPVVADGKVFVGSLDGKFYCLNAADGAFEWSHSTAGGYSSAAVSGGRVYIGGGDGKLYCFGSSPSLTLEGVTSWYWQNSTAVRSVACGDVDGDSQREIVSAGSFFDGVRDVAQLVVWNGSNFAVDRLMTWYWTGNTTINSVAIGDVDGDAESEIVTGGYYYDGVRKVAQLVVWSGATLAVEGIRAWYWTGDTVINSVAVGDVDGDAQTEILTGGYYNDGTRNTAQLVVWTGSGLTVDRLTAWYWTGNTVIKSLAIGDVDADGQVEIVTGGYFNDGTRNVAQLVVWAGSSLAVDRLTSWYWTGNTVINSVALGDVDGDGQAEIVTGGSYFDGVRDVAQLVVWTGSSLAVDRLTSWYWTGNTAINSLAIGDVDGNGIVEIVTGGSYFDGARDNSQLVIWNGSNLAVEGIRTWYWTGNTAINSVAVADVNGDFAPDIATGGAYHDGTRQNAQLTVWGFS